MESQEKFNYQDRIEIFPPKTEEGKTELQRVRKELTSLNPANISVTFRVGGSSLQRAFDVLKSFMDAGINADPYIFCVDQTKPETRDALYLSGW